MARAVADDAAQARGRAAARPPATRWTELAGAANTLLLDDDGGRHGLNTDVPGAEAAIGQATDDARCARAVVLGGGATATSVLLALAERGLRARDRGRARPGPRRGHACGAGAAPARHPRSTVVAVRRARRRSRPTSSSRPCPPAAQTDALLVAAVADVPVVFEVVYDPWPTPLAAAATAPGRTLVGGLDLLLWQAVDQVRAMTGRFDVPVDGHARRPARRDSPNGAAAGRSPDR